MPEPLSFRQSLYFAGCVFVTVEIANFPVTIFEDWKERAVAISVVNLLILLIAVFAGLLALRILRARTIRVTTLSLAGIVSGIQLIQFAPFMFPMAYPQFVVIGGVLSAFVPMMVTLLVLGYLFSIRKNSLSLDARK